jgi:hypothetical protein
MSDGFGETTILNHPPVAETDLSSQIERAVKKDPLDRVRCVRVFDNFYRCNWWAEAVGDVASKHPSVWGAVATERVRKSRFLNATMVGDKLVVQEMIPHQM